MHGRRAAAVFSLFYFFALGFIVEHYAENAIFAFLAVIMIARKFARQGKAVQVETLGPPNHRHAPHFAGQSPNFSSFCRIKILSTQCGGLIWRLLTQES